MKLAFYKAAEGTIIDKGVNIWTGRYGYSHIELVFSDDMSFSASPREGKVRFKKINFNPKKWEFVDLDVSELEETKIRTQAKTLEGRKYDYYGICLWYILPIKKQKSCRWWCSEIVAFLLKWDKFRVDPNTMAKHYNLTKQPFSFRLSISKTY